jgi:hypothetical protein
MKGIGLNMLADGRKDSVTMTSLPQSKDTMKNRAKIELRMSSLISSKAQVSG